MNPPVQQIYPNKYIFKNYKKDSNIIMLIAIIFIAKYIRRE
jgi:hypothetical protein